MMITRLGAWVLRLSLPGLAAIAIMLAAAAQSAHVSRQADRVALVFFAGAVAIWLIVVASNRVAIPAQLDQPAPLVARRTSPISRRHAASILGLALLSFLLSTDNTFTQENVLPWLLSIAVFLHVFWEPQKSWGEWRASLREHLATAQAFWSGGMKVSPRALLLVSILLLSGFSYFHDLDDVPAEMTSDHAEKILDVNDVLTGARPIFFERNTGREPLQFYLTAAFVELGNHRLDYMALKLVTSMIGVLVVLGTFFLARELFDDDVAYLAAALVAIGSWPLAISRIGLRYPLTPVFVAPMLLFLFRALKYQRRNDFLMAGLFLGIGLYGYSTFRMALPLAAILLALRFVAGTRMERSQSTRYLTNSLLLFAFALTVFIPLLRYSVDQPKTFWYRTLTRISGTERPLGANPAQTLASNVVNTALMFNWRGDEGWPAAIPGEPVLDHISGGLFLLGMAYASYRLMRYRERTYLFVLICLAVMLLPSTLSLAFPNENPSTVRSSGAIPFVFIIAALPLAWLGRALRESLGHVAGVACIALILAVTTGANYMRYFHDYDLSYRQSSWNTTEVAEAIRAFVNSVGDYDHAWLLSYPHWVDTRNVAINAGRIGWDPLLSNAELARDWAEDGANKMFVLNPSDRGNLAKLQEFFPDGKLREYHSRAPGRDFYVYYVSGNIAPSVPPATR